MKSIMLGVLFLSASASAAPLIFPVFLKMGFSSVLEFDEPPSRVVLGDGQLFQVERLDRSLVIRSLAPYATSNMFVYFRNGEPRMFVLTSSEDAQPTYYKKFDSPLRKPPSATLESEKSYPPGPGTRVLSTNFDSEKDFLTVEIVLAATSNELLRPKWNLIRVIYNRSAISPDQLWAERKEVQRDSEIRVRLIFTKPNVPRSLAGVRLVIPIEGQVSPIRISLSKRSR